MSEIIPLNVTLELPANEMTDSDAGPQVRCQKCRRFVLMADYYSEKQGQLLPLVGNADCKHTEIERSKNAETGEMEISHVPACDWKETVRILEKDEKPAEGGNLAFNTADAVKSDEKFG